MLLLRNFISKVPLGSVINVKCNGEIIDSFKAKDFIINKNIYIRLYYRGVKSIDINGKYNFTVDITPEKTIQC